MFRNKINLITGLFVLLVLLGGCAAGSMTQIREEDKTFNRVVEAKGFKQDQIHEGAKVWIAENFRSAKAVIEYDNKAEGALIGNGMMNYPCKGIDCLAKSDWHVNFTMRVDSKDEKFRVTFTNITVGWPAKSDTLGYHAAHDGPLKLQSELSDIKPVLLAYGDQILANLSQHKQSKDW